MFLLHAGVNQVADQSVPLPFIFTRHAGSFGQQMAEYVSAQIVCKEKKLFTAHCKQLQRKWWEKLTAIYIDT